MNLAGKGNDSAPWPELNFSKLQFPALASLENLEPIRLRLPPEELSTLSVLSAAAAGTVSVLGWPVSAWVPALLTAFALGGSNMCVISTEAVRIPSCQFTLRSSSPEVALLGDNEPVLVAATNSSCLK